MRNLSPAIKAVITAGLMIVASLLIDKWHEVLDLRIQYLVYLLYLGGIIWSLMATRGNFGQLFSTGFRHFIVVTILMVCFTYVFVKTHPELALQEHRRLQ